MNIIPEHHHPITPTQTRPSVPEMLRQLEHAYQQLLIHSPSAVAAERRRLSQVLEDFYWYSERLGASRWDHSPRPGRWSFAENLWHITEQAIAYETEAIPQPVRYYIDHGKEHVGQAAELLAIFSTDDDTWL